MSTWKLLAICLAALALVGCAPAANSPTPSASGSATVGLTYIPNIQFAPFYVADSEGYFGDEGADVTLRHHGSNEGLFTALLSGDENFVLAGAGEMMQARSEGSDLVAIASYYREYPVRVIVPGSSTYKSAADLKGKKIGIPGKYGETWFGLQAFLASANLTEKDVNIVEIGYTQQAALTTGKVDAVVGYVNNDAVAFEQAGFPVRSLTVGKDVPLVSVSLITTRQYAEDNPELTKAVIAAMARGVSASVDDPTQTLEISEKYIPNSSTAQARKSAKATLEATIPLFTADDGPNAHLSEDQFAAMAKFMRAQGLIATDVDASKSMTNDYVD